MTLERSNSSAWSVARASHDHGIWRDDQRIHEGNNRWSTPNVTGAFPRQVNIGGHGGGQTPLLIGFCLCSEQWRQRGALPPRAKTHAQLPIYAGEDSWSTLEISHSIAQSVARDFQDQETWSTIRGSMQERNHSSAQFVTGTFPHCPIKELLMIHQRILKGKRQKAFKCTKWTVHLNQSM